MEVDEGSDQTSDIYPYWMAAHARLKNEFKEDEKCHNLMRWLILGFRFPLLFFVCAWKRSANIWGLRPGRFKLACPAIETSWRLEVLHIKTTDIMLSKQRITKALMNMTTTHVSWSYIDGY